MRFNKKDDHTGPKPINDLFEKYRKTLKAPQGTVIQTSIEVIYDLVGVQIPKDKVSYKPHSKILYLRISGPLKSEILVRKAEVLNHIRGRIGGQGSPSDIL